MEFESLTAPLIGTTIGHAWKGYGSAIFLELGELREADRSGRPKGESTIAIERDWRIEQASTILFGSSNSGPQIQKRIGELEGATIESLEAFGQVPELQIGLSTGHRVRTAAMVTGDPEWSIALGDGDWLYVESGHLKKGDGAPVVSPEERVKWELEEQAVERWSVPSIASGSTECSRCRFFVGLDGQGPLLTYGVCLAAEGPFDGRVVHWDMGCPQFQPSDED